MSDVSEIALGLLDPSPSGRIHLRHPDSEAFVVGDREWLTVKDWWLAVEPWDRQIDWRWRVSLHGRWGAEWQRPLFRVARPKFPVDDVDERLRRLEEQLVQTPAVEPDPLKLEAGVYPWLRLEGPPGALEWLRARETTVILHVTKVVA